MADQIIRAKDGAGVPRDLARQLDDGSWGLAVDGYMTIEASQYNTLIGHIDNVETLLTNIGNNTDGLEGFSDGVEGLLTSLNTYVDTLEAITNDIDLNTDELEARIGEISATPTANTLQDRLKGIKATLDSMNSAGATAANQATTNTKLDTVIGHVDAVESKLDILAGYLDGVEGSLTSLVGKDFATQTTLASVLSAVDSLEAQIGEVSTTPTANTVQDRLKNIKVALDDISATDASILARLSSLDKVLLSSRDIFDATVTSQKYTQLESDFSAGVPSNVTLTKSGGAAETTHEGHVHFETGTGANGQIKARTQGITDYKSGNEQFALCSARFATPTSASSYQRIGLYSDTDGFFVGYNGTTFGVGHRRNSVDTHIARASWNVDQLNGSVGSLYTRAGTPEAYNPSLLNVFRIRFGWLGSAPIVFEILSPDGRWVAFHVIRQPNISAEPSLTTPNLPLTLEASKTGSDSTNLAIASACWAAGVTSPMMDLNATITDKTLSTMTRAVITAKQPNGNYVNIAANSQGRLLFALGSVGTTGSAAPAEANEIGGVDAGGILRSVKTDTGGQVYTINTNADAKLDTVIGHVDGVETKLDTLISKDFATETTQASVLLAVNDVEAKLDTLHTDLDTVETKLQAIADKQADLTLTARMFAKQAATGYRIWLDTSKADGLYLFIGEALIAQTDETQSNWRGIRITVDANGDPNGKVEESTAFRWDTKAGTWS